MTLLRPTRPVARPVRKSDGSGASCTSVGIAAGDTPTGGKHRTPLNGTKKTNGTKKAEETGASVSGGGGTGADSSNSSSSSTGGDSDT